MAHTCRACGGAVCEICGGCVNHGECSCIEDKVAEATAQLRAENERLRVTLESEPLASVMKLANHHYCVGTWQGESEDHWLAGLAEEVLELTAALGGKHEHSPDVELRQIASIALNWLNMRRVHGA